MRSRMTCQPVTWTSSTSRRSNCCFWVSSRVVDDGVDAGGEVMLRPAPMAPGLPPTQHRAGSELIVAGEGGAFVSESGSIVLQLFSACGDLGRAKTLPPHPQMANRQRRPRHLPQTRLRLRPHPHRPHRRSTNQARVTFSARSSWPPRGKPAASLAHAKLMAGRRAHLTPFTRLRALGWHRMASRAMTPEDGRDSARGERLADVVNNRLCVQRPPTVSVFMTASIGLTFGMPPVIPNLAVGENRH
jgi:hypothetical protein